MQSFLKNSTKTKPNLMKYNVTKRKRQNETKCNAFRQLVQKFGVKRERERKKTNKKFEIQLNFLAQLFAG